MLNKYLLISLTAVAAGGLAGCEDDPPAGQTTTAAVQNTQQQSEPAPVKKSTEFRPAPKLDSATIFSNPQEYLKTLVVEGDVALDIFVANQTM